MSRNKKSLQKKYIVYRYIDLKDKIIKYVGITERKLQQRVNEHKKNDSWTNQQHWKIEYFFVNSKSTMEAWESHLIAEYESFRWYNIAKKSWGVIDALREVTPQWRIFSIDDCVVDFPFEQLPFLLPDNCSGLVSDSFLMEKYGKSKEEIYMEIKERKLSPLAITEGNTLLFLESIYA